MTPDNAEADRNLLQRVKGFLYQRCYGPHRALEISVEQGVAVIKGRMPTFYLRQIAVESIKRVAGVIQVVDLIEVADDLCQRQPVDKPKDTESSAASTRHRADVPGMPSKSHDAPRSDFHRRRLLTVKG